MKLINISGHASFKNDVPLTYRRSLFLALILEAFTGQEVKRIRGKLGTSDGKCACALGLFVDLAHHAKYGNGGEGVDACYALPAAAFPDEVRLLDRDFLGSVMDWNDNDANWLKSGQSLTNTGKKALNKIVDEYGFRGISESTGLSKFL